MEKWESGKVGKSMKSDTWKNGKRESGKVEKWKIESGKWKSGKVEKWKSES